MLEDAHKYNALYIQLITEAIACAPSHWLRGTLIIEREVERVSCRLQHENQSIQAEISDALRSLCEQYAVCKNASGSDPSWLKAVINYYLDDEAVDWSVEGSFEYPDDPLPGVEPEALPNESWWRTQTQNLAWQESPSLLVIEFIMDYRVWNDAALRQSQDAPFSLETSQSIQAHWQTLLDKFCLPSLMGRPVLYTSISAHDIECEAVFSAETVDDQALVKTRIEDELEGDSQSVEVSYEYELKRVNH
ncbi:MAG: hypothetical protein ACFCU8_09670 [Thermosynechococcaceae cyanobacterium]